MERQDILIVGCVSDDPFAIDVAHFFGQRAEIADLIALKSFANTEFCPRFISDENDLEHIGAGLAGKTVFIVSTCCGVQTRNSLAMRTFLVARAAKDNGASQVVLVEPDLFYSAQDRGPRPEHGDVSFPRELKDFKKFDGQPFSAKLYAQLLRASGVAGIVTIHNHSLSVDRLFSQEFDGQFFNLSPARLYAHYLASPGAGVVTNEEMPFVLCAPDEGAAGFVQDVKAALEATLSRRGTAGKQATGKQATGKQAAGKPPAGSRGSGRPSGGQTSSSAIPLLQIEKVRSGERRVQVHAAADSPVPLAAVKNRVVVVLDDMVRTGHTIRECCHLLKKAGASRVVFLVTHFYSSEEVKENLSTPAIDEIVTTNSLPGILNRDMQGRLRRKMLVLKIEKWIASFIAAHFCDHRAFPDEPLYSIDMSSKNPRWREHRHLMD